mmetsp:Transcript_18910/g.33872  ORF Transcript_18910/g.33872 Transcript_18910/m.33872 type:complete len:251 (+) Transcript_18910:615-1367(+)
MVRASGPKEGGAGRSWFQHRRGFRTSSCSSGRRLRRHSRNFACKRHSGLPGFDVAAAATADRGTGAESGAGNPGLHAGTPADESDDRCNGSSSLSLGWSGCLPRHALGRLQPIWHVPALWQSIRWRLWAAASGLQHATGWFFQWQRCQQPGPPAGSAEQACSQRRRCQFWQLRRRLGGVLQFGSCCSCQRWRQHCCRCCCCGCGRSEGCSPGNASLAIFGRHGSARSAALEEGACRRESRCDTEQGQRTS